jgi:aminoglycoside 3-N-acetyltransferase
MKKFTIKDLAITMGELGIKKHDLLFVHADLTYLGEMEGGIEPIGYTLHANCGCLAAPTFSFQYCDTREFNVAETSSMLGVLSNYIRKQGRRSHHPTESVAAWGQGQVGITTNNPACAYDEGGAFDMLYRENAKTLFLGVKDFDETMIHFAERIAGVPYRYWKLFPGRIYDNTGWHEFDCKRYVRDRDKNVQLSSVPIAERLAKYNLIETVPLNYGQVSICNVRDWVDIAVDMLEKDSYALVKGRSNT